MQSSETHPEELTNIVHHQAGQGHQGGETGPVYLITFSPTVIAVSGLVSCKIHTSQSVHGKSFLQVIIRSHYETKSEAFQGRQV